MIVFDKTECLCRAFKEIDKVRRRSNSRYGDDEINRRLDMAQDDMKRVMLLMDYDKAMAVIKEVSDNDREED